jgi:hypothetical protein
MTRVRLMAALTAVLAAGTLLGSPVQSVAEPNRPPALISADEAMAQAKRSGLPTVATALTDEHTLVTADPATGLMVADMSAGTARVPDGAGGWREPSASLVHGADGWWRPEAAAASVAISNGGTGSFLTLADTTGSIAFTWSGGALPVPDVDANLATYSEVVPGTDLVVRASVDGAESFLVVKNAQAAQNSAARSLPITVTARGLSLETHANGAVSYADNAGQGHFMLPPAYMWDSGGQDKDAPIADLLDPAEGAQVEAVPASVSKTTKTASFASASAKVASILDDPDTVYPVVIDPSLSLDETHALRVTQTFHKYDSDIGSTAKLGYNGWTSPYYKSRMYYQFKWPVNNDKSIINPAQIASGKFTYKQTYSPQSSCSDHGFGPSVRVQPSGVLDGDVSWDDQPGLHSGSLYSTDDYAVGQDCGSHTQEWNVTEMLKKERVDYSTRTTVTLRVSSSDESDRNGWREYANNSSSPDLTVSYEPEPPAPTAFTVSNTVATSPLTTSSAAPKLGVTAKLASGYKCRASTKCIQADFTVKPKGSSTTIVSGLKSAAITDDSPQATVDLPAIGNGTYTATVRTYNLDTKLYSTTAVSVDFTVDPPPGKPTWWWVVPAGWNNPSALPAGQALELQVSAAVGDADVTSFCVTVVREGESTQTCTVPTNGRVTVGPFSVGSASVSVAAKDAYTIGDARLDNPPERAFSW